LDEDNTQVCNYTTCDYDCVDPDPKEIDYSTYDVYYKDELIENVKSKLVELFMVKNTYTAREIFEFINEYPIKFILQGIAEMIKNRTSFFNRYGYLSFLNEDGDKFYLKNEVNTYTTDSVDQIYDITKNTIASEAYNENLYAVGKKDFDETIRQIRKPFDEKKATKLLASNDILEQIEKMDSNTIITLVEGILEKEIKNIKLTTNEKKVLKKYENLIYRLGEPISLLYEKQQERVEPAKAKRGRKKDLSKPVKIKKLKKEIDVDEIEFGDPVVVHILDLLRAEKSGYRATTKFEKGDANIRIFKSDEDKWRDTTEIEKLAYNTLIQNSIMQTFDKMFKDKDIYGTILTGNTFRIIDKSKENVKAKKNRHYELKGQECTSPTFQKITDMLYKLKISPEDFEIEMEEYPKDQDKLIKYLQTKKEYKTEGMSKPELVAAAKWVATGMKKDGLCKYVQQYFDANNLLFKLIQ
jgi:hypothetical protein